MTKMIRSLLIVATISFILLFVILIIVEYGKYG